MKYVSSVKCGKSREINVCFSKLGNDGWGCRWNKIQKKKLKNITIINQVTTAWNVEGFFKSNAFNSILTRMIKFKFIKGNLRWCRKKNWFGGPCSKSRDYIRLRQTVWWTTRHAVKDAEISRCKGYKLHIYNTLCRISLGKVMSSQGDITIDA